MTRQSFVPLNASSVFRIVCKNERCGAAVVLPARLIADNEKCRFCGELFESPDGDERAFISLAKAILALHRAEEHVELDVVVVDVDPAV